MLRIAAFFLFITSSVNAQEYKISLLSYGYQFQAQTNRALDSFKEAALSGGGVSWQHIDARLDPSVQIGAAHEAINAGFDKIIIDPINLEVANEVSRMANEAGVPVIFISSFAVEEDVLGEEGLFFGIDYYSVGLRQALWYCEKSQAYRRDDARFLALSDLSSSDTQDLSVGLADILSNDACHGAVTVDWVSAANAASGSNAVTSWDVGWSQTPVVFASSPEMVLGVAQSFLDRGQLTADLYLVGVGQSQQVLDLIDLGVFDASVTVNSDEWGRLLYDLAASDLDDTAPLEAPGRPRKCPKRTHCYEVPLEVIDASNTSDFSQ